MLVKKLFGDSVVYGFSKYLWVLSSIVLTPIYTRMLSMADYGVMDIYNTWVAFAVLVVPLGLVKSILRFYPDMRDDRIKVREVSGTVFTALLGLGAIYTIAMLLVKKGFQETFIGYQGSSEIYYHTIFLVVGGVLRSYGEILLQAKMEKYKYAAIALTSMATLMVLGFVLVYYYNMGILGFFRASSISVALTLSLAFYFVRHEISWVFHPQTFKWLFNYSVHFIFVFFLFQATEILDRYLINTYDSLDGIGIYAMGNKIAGFLQVFISSFTLAWMPMAMRMKDDPDAKRVFGVVHDAYLLAIFLVLMVVIVFRAELVAFFAPDYIAAYNIIGLIGLYKVVISTAYFYTLGLNFKKKTKYFGLAATISVVVNILVSIALLRQIGLDGIAWGTLVGGFAWILVQFFISHRLFPVRYNFWLSAVIVLSGIAMLPLMGMIERILDFGFYQNMALKLAAFSVLVVAVGYYLVKKQVLKMIMAT